MKTDRNLAFALLSGGLAAVGVAAIIYAATRWLIHLYETAPLESALFFTGMYGVVLLIVGGSALNEALGMGP